MKERITKTLQNPEGNLRLLLATEAYSMGADPARVRAVVHIGPTSNLESMSHLKYYRSPLK